MPDSTAEDSIIEDYPIRRGDGNALIRRIEQEDISVGDQGSRYIYHDNSYRTLNQVGLKDYLIGRANSPRLTKFEESLVAKWKDFIDPKLIPLYQLGDVGLVGYMLTTGGSGLRTHTLYNRRGDKIREFYTEVPLINMGLGPIDYLLLISGAVALGRVAIGKFVAKRAAARAATAALEKEVINEAGGVLAVIQDGKILAQSRNTLLSHEVFVQRKLGWGLHNLPKGAEVVTIGKYEGEIGAVLSRTFHPAGGFASRAAQEAAKKAFK